MADFDITYGLTNAAEGGYSNRGAADKGGETYQGIARNFNPSWDGWAIIDAYKAAHGSIANGSNPDELANNAQLQASHKAFVQSKYWVPVYGDTIPDQDMANLMYTIQFNTGSSKVTQQAVNALSPIKVVEDGVIGQDTLSKILSLPPNDFYQTLKEKLADYYKSIAYGGNLTGWLSRLSKFPDQISEGVQQAASDVAQTASNTVADVSQTASNAVSDVAQTASNTVADVSQTVSDVAQDVSQTATDIVADPMAGIKQHQKIVLFGMATIAISAMLAIMAIKKLQNTNG